LSDDPTLLEVLARVRLSMLGALANQDIPFERLVEELRPPRDLSRTPIFQTLFVMQNTPAPTFGLAGLAVEPVELPLRTANFELTLSMTETNGELSGALVYNTALFDGSTAEQLARHFVAILEALVEDPARAMSVVPLLGASELERV